MHNTQNKALRDLNLRYMTRYQEVNHGADYNSNNVSNNKKDIRFYKKRIILIMKDLMKKENKELYGDELIHSFESFLGHSINYLQTIDKNRIIQSKYVKLQEKHNLTKNIDVVNMKEINNTMLNPDYTKPKYNTISKMIPINIKFKEQKNVKETYPQQIEYNESYTV